MCKKKGATYMNVEHKDFPVELMNKLTNTSKYAYQDSILWW